MATAKWATAGSLSSNFAGTTLNSLANGSVSAFITYDNATDKSLYGLLVLKLGSITPTAGGSITAIVHAAQASNTPDDTGSVGGGERYPLPLTTSTGAKIATAKISLIGPFSLRLQFLNSSGVTLNASGNEVYIQPWNEDVS